LRIVVNAGTVYVAVRAYRAGNDMNLDARKRASDRANAEMQAEMDRGMYVGEVRPRCLNPALPSPALPNLPLLPPFPNRYCREQRVQIIRVATVSWPRAITHFSC